jgi:oxalate decarboxylase/phosphoglucose isomerase-like protein (cupin superfamily)
MELIKKFSRDKLHFEYGLDGIRTFPWEGIEPPFAGGYCIVRPGDETLAHVNSPSDEDEMFIAIQGNAEVVLDGKATAISQGDIVMIPRGMDHFIRNTSEEPFHFYTVWWSSQDVARYQTAETAKAREVAST